MCTGGNGGSLGDGTQAVTYKMSDGEVDVYYPKGSSGDPVIAWKNTIGRAYLKFRFPIIK